MHFYLCGEPAGSGWTHAFNSSTALMWRLALGEPVGRVSTLLLLWEPLTGSPAMPLYAVK